MNKKFLAMAALALITTGAQAKVKLPHILGDNMILQQNTEASLWGCLRIDNSNDHFHESLF